MDKTTVATFLSIISSRSWVLSQQVKGLQYPITDDAIREAVTSLQNDMAHIATLVDIGFASTINKKGGVLTKTQRLRLRVLDARGLATIFRDSVDGSPRTEELAKDAESVYSSAKEDLIEHIVAADFGEVPDF